VILQKVMNSLFGGALSELLTTNEKVYSEISILGRREAIVERL
jgi:hypothetical protein